MMTFRIWVLVELHLSPLYFFHRILKFSSSSRFYDCFFFILWKTLQPIGLRTGPGFNPHGNPGLSFFFKNHWEVILTLERTWESILSLVLPKCHTYMVILNLRIRLKTKMKTRSCSENLPTLVLTTDLDHWFHQIKN